MTRLNARLLATGGVILSMLLIYGVQVEIDQRQAHPPGGDETLYVRDPELMRRLSLGYESLLADIYWLRAVQYYGRKPKKSETQSYAMLEPLLNLATTFDPEMTAVYRFGAMFLSESQPIGPGEPLKAIELLNKGIMNNPNVWRFYFDKGFVYLWHLKDHKAAGRAFLEGARLPAAPKWLESLAATSMGEAGELETARYLWTHEFEEAESESVRSNARNHLNSLQIDEDRWRLEFLVTKFQEKTGRVLTDLNQLVNAGCIRFIPTDPSGAPYEYDRDAKGVYPAKASKVTYFPLKAEARKVFQQKLESEWEAARTAPQ
ncbi:MAG: hypothetical protein HYR55_05615 [Acidobacteria bacterium]|nr:hypothetical protein [Acidobacteriota bacterium]MBI3656496.1 hypothetical protein [Acidobacteriota bacterium]